MRTGWAFWSWAGENAERGTRNAEQPGRFGPFDRGSTSPPLFRVPTSAFRVHAMSVIVVLDQPQDLVNIAHVVRALKNFGFRDLRLVNPREYDAYRVQGIAHQTQDILARVQRFETLEAALADCVHVAGFTARGRSAKRNLQRPRAAAAENLERLCADVEQALRLIEFFKTRDVDGVMRTVREVMHRAPLDEREIKLLRAMAIEVVKYAERLARSRVHVDR